MLSAQDWLTKIHALPFQGTVRIMNVCGGHERSISMAGLRSALPKNIELIAGPGCPVCVPGRRCVPGDTTGHACKCHSGGVR
jgi:hydrogenase expression/formation protein HypD